MRYSQTCVHIVDRGGLSDAKCKGPDHVQMLSGGHERRQANQNPEDAVLGMLLSDGHVGGGEGNWSREIQSKFLILHTYVNADIN